MKIVITGGHHTSALPIISRLLQDHQKIKIFWLGHKHTSKGDKNPTLEFVDITRLGIPFYNLTAGKFYRTYNPFRLVKIPLGFLHAFYLLLTIRPDLVLSFGGYLAVPVVIMAWVLGIPSVTHEQTSVAGWANLVVAKFAKKIMITWPSSQKYFPAHKVVKTGLPLRSELFEPVSSTLILNTNLPTVYVTAGKTGSHKINKAVEDALPDLLKICNVIHQCGDNSVFADFKSLSETYKTIQHDRNVSGHYLLKKFVLSHEIGEIMQKASMLICRGGAHTCLEIVALSKPALIIPIPWVSHNEQFLNAKLLQDSGIAQILEETRLNKDTLFKEVSEMLKNLSSYKIDPSTELSYTSKESEQLILNEILRFETNN